jgi:hypothetical protein
MSGEKRQDIEQHWLQEYNSLQSENCSIVNKYPEADCALKQVYEVLGDIVSLSGCTPSSVGESESWRLITENVKQDRLNLCKVLHGKCLFSALVGTYTVTLNELKRLLQGSMKPSSGIQVVASTSAEPALEVSRDGFREQRRRKRSNTSDDELATHKKVNPQTSTLLEKKPVEVSTKNYYTPLRTVEMDAEDIGDSPAPEEEQQQKKTGRPPPIVLTSAINLINSRTTCKLSSKEITSSEAHATELKLSPVQWPTTLP